MQNEFETHTPALLGFVISVHYTLLAQIRKELIEAVRLMESDEKAYIYTDYRDEIPRWQGQAVASVANFGDDELVFPPDGIKQTIRLMAGEDHDTERHIFIIVDDVELVHRWKTAMIWDEKQHIPCKFHVCDYSGLHGEILEGIHPRIHYYPKLGKGDLQRLVLSEYKKHHAPFFVQNYERLNIHELKEDYKKNYGEAKLTEGEESSPEEISQS